MTHNQVSIPNLFNQITGFISITGVPSSTSRLATRISLLLIDKISATCRPIGLGRSGDRVAKTPVKLASGLFLGFVFNVLLSPLSSHVKIKILAPAFSPELASTYSELMIIEAAGAPSFSCKGQSFNSCKVDRICPINFSVSIKSKLRMNRDESRRDSPEKNENFSGWRRFATF